MIVSPEKRKINLPICGVSFPADSEYLLHPFCGQDFQWFPTGGDQSIRKQDQMIAVMRSQPQIVEYDEDRLSSGFQVVQQKKLVTDIQMVSGLVQDQSIRSLGNGPGDKGQFPLPA